MRTIFKTTKSLRSLLVVLLVFLFTVSISQAQTSFTVDTTWGCDSLTVTFTNTSSGASYYSWDYDNGDGYFGFDTTYTFTGPGTYEVQLFALDSFFNFLGFASTEIMVYGLNWAGSSMDTICPGDGMQFYYDGAGTSFYWDFGDGNSSTEEYPMYFYSANGVYNGFLAINAGCPGDPDTAYFTVIVDSSAQVNADFGYEPGVSCPGDEFQFYTNVPRETYGAYSWDFGDGSTSDEQDPRHAYTSTGTYTVTLTAFSKCGNQATTTQTVTVSNNVPIGFVGLYIPEVCQGDNIQLQLFGDQTTFQSYLWDFGDGSPVDSINANPVHSYSNLGSYTVAVTLTNGCGFDTTITGIANVTTTAVPVLGNEQFGTAEEGPYCPGDSVLFFFAGTGNNMWHFGDGDSAMAVDTLVVNDNGNVFTVTYLQHAYTDTGTYTVSLTLTNGCGNSATDVFQLDIANGQSASADFVWSPPPGGGNYSICEEVEFLAIGGVLYQWDFDDGDSASTANITINHAFLDPGTYTVTLGATNGCGNSDAISYDIVIEGFDLSATSTDDACDLGVGTATAAAGNGTLPFTYSWDDALSQTTATAVNLDSGIYMVDVMTAGGCMESVSVVVVMAPDMIITPSSTTPLSCGTTSGSVAVSVSGTGPFTYLWDDPAAQVDSIAIGLAAGSYYVDVTDGYGCMATIAVNLSDPGTGTISIIPTDVSCTGGADGSAIATITGGTAPFTYEWNDLATTTMANVSGLEAEIYTIEVMDASGCLASASVTIDEPVDPLTLAIVFVTNATIEGASDGAATVLASGGTAPYAFTWNTSPVQTNAAAIGIIAGTYTALVTDNNGCVDSVIVTVLDGPVGIAELGAKVTYNIHPNPNHGQFELDIKNGSGEYLMTMRNIIGKVLYQEKERVNGARSITFDNSEHPSGLYFLTIENGEEVSTIKVVIH